MKWTDQQRAAIDARGENLLLSAAAGSGKTTVLVERVLSLIREGADMDDMLIVTFTRAAASDMRASLIRALEKAALTEPRFRPQAERAELAFIGTIHSFCTELLRAHFQKAGIDPAFRVADSAEAAILKNKPAQDRNARNKKDNTDEVEEEDDYFDPTRNPFDPNDKGRRRRGGAGSY